MTLRRYRLFDSCAGYSDVRAAINAGRPLSYEEAADTLGYEPEGPSSDNYVLGLDATGVFVIRTEGRRRVAITYLHPRGSRD